MEIGDKVYCIKNRYNSAYNVVNKSGKTYKIVDFYNDQVYINNELNDNSDNHFYYTLDDEDTSHYIYKKYFNNIKEERKQKLLKIKDGLDEDRL